MTKFITIQAKGGPFRHINIDQIIEIMEDGNGCVVSFGPDTRSVKLEESLRDFLERLDTRLR